MIYVNLRIFEVWIWKRGKKIFMKKKTFVFPDLITNISYKNCLLYYSFSFTLFSFHLPIMTFFRLPESFPTCLFPPSSVFHPCCASLLSSFYTFQTLCLLFFCLSTLMSYLSSFFLALPGVLSSFLRVRPWVILSFPMCLLPSFSHSFLPILTSL